MIFDLCTRPSALTTPPTVTQPPAPHSPARSPPKKPSLRKTWDSPADSFLPPPQALAREGRSHSKKSSRHGSTTKDQTLAEPLVLEVRDRARADENTPAPARSPSPRSPRPPVSSSSSRRPFSHTFASSTCLDLFQSHIDPSLTEPALDAGLPRGDGERTLQTSACKRF